MKYDWKYSSSWDLLRTEVVSSVVMVSVMPTIIFFSVLSLFIEFSMLAYSMLQVSVWITPVMSFTFLLKLNRDHKPYDFRKCHRVLEGGQLRAEAYTYKKFLSGVRGESEVEFYTNEIVRVHRSTKDTVYYSDHNSETIKQECLYRFLDDYPFIIRNGREKRLDLI